MYELALYPGLPHRGMRLMCGHAFPCVKHEHVQLTTSYTFTSWHATTNSVCIVGKFWVMLDKGHAVKMKQSKRHDYIVRDSKLRVDYYRRPALQYYYDQRNYKLQYLFFEETHWIVSVKRPRAFAAQASKIGVGGCTEEGLNHPLVCPCFVFSQTRPDQPWRNFILLENRPTSSLALPCKPPQGSSFAAYAKFLTRLT